MLNAFSITLACAFCSCLLSCSERQLQEKYLQFHRLTQNIITQYIIIDKNSMIQTINQIIKLATHEMNQNNWISANYQLVNGLNTLGNRYMPPPNVIFRDDSDMKLIVASDFESQGQLKRAAGIRMRILQSRFDEFKSNP
jgi:hypothetical protein